VSIGEKQHEIQEINFKMEIVSVNILPGLWASIG